MSNIILFHGSDHVIKHPELKLGKLNNDYGQGFYCTKSVEMAREWACKENRDGFVNKYELDMSDLKVLNLLDGKHHILNWIAILLQNRKFALKNEIAVDARDYIVQDYGLDVSEYDVVIGYRADDSYFSYAESFVENGLPLRCLNDALRLGKLGEQMVLVSEKAFERVTFISASPVDKTIYYPKFTARDTEARETYRNEIRRSRSYRDDLFVLDILREELRNDDPRIQRIVSE